jgi:hypothetical protein
VLGLSAGSEVGEPPVLTGARNAIGGERAMMLGDGMVERDEQGFSHG